MTTDPHHCAGLGLRPDAEKALARVLRSALGRSGPAGVPFSPDDHVLLEVREEAAALLPELFADLLRDGLGSPFGEYRRGGYELPARVADARDRISDAARRGRRRYAVERLRPTLLDLASDIGRLSEAPGDNASQEQALALWSALERPLFPLQQLADTHIEPPGKPPGAARGSLEKLVLRIPDTLFGAERGLRRLALGPMPTEPGEAEKFWEEILALVSASVALMRGLAGEISKERRGASVGAAKP